MKVRLVSVGKDKSGLFAPGVEEYRSRLTHYVTFSLVELPPARTAEAEGEKILQLRTPQEWLVVLDERGEQKSSIELSQLLAKAQRAAKDLLFALGGDEGHGPTLRAAADVTLSLSRMTLPHRLARLVLIEQLYRGFTLLRGEPYHK